MIRIKMKKPVVLLSIIFPLCLQAQQHPYKELGLGNYAVGYADTVLFNANEHYNAYDYSGPSPLFIKVWFPLTSRSEAPFLPYSAFREASLPNTLRAVYGALMEQMKLHFIEYSLSETAVTYEALDFSPHTVDEVAMAIQGMQSRSVQAALPLQANLPVIVYHHGSQGLADENVLMAEYFGSRGYIFIASNFHLPYPEKQYGLHECLMDNPSAAKCVLDFAGYISPNGARYFVGHSWGAQVGWTLLQNYNAIDAFVSLETTIEWKTDTLEIKDKWPYVYTAIHKQAQPYSMPILMLAFTENDKPFDFFKDVKAEEMIQGGSRDFFDHEAYTSNYFMRYFLRDQYMQADTAALGGQFNLYIHHLELIHAFFESQKAGKLLELSPFQERFYLQRL